MQTLCTECKSKALSKAYKKDKTQKPHTCKICGTTFTSVARRAHICADCKSDKRAMQIYRATLAAESAKRKLDALLSDKKKPNTD